MKRTILILGLILTGLWQSISAEQVGTISNSVQPVTSNGVKDGWYDATVKYSNYSTYTHATYTLSVYVQYNTVVKIDFGNGGSIHSGYNNEGYTYSGGYLSFENDFNGNIIAATTTITFYNNSGTRTYNIRIE